MPVWNAPAVSEVDGKQGVYRAGLSRHEVYILS